MGAEAATTLVLVRHGRTPTTGKELPGRRAGLSLAPDGHDQARRAAVALRERFERAVLYTSPLERARETAAPFEEAFGLQAQVDEDLVEVDVGAWTGWSLGMVRRRKEWATLLAAASTFRFPGGESLVEVLERVRRFARRTAQRHPGQVVIATSHADPIRLLAADALGIHVEGVHRLWVETASATSFVVTNDAINLMYKEEKNK
jgi:broad specificity phosphatase PhoE